MGTLLWVYNKHTKLNNTQYFCYKEKDVEDPNQRPFHFKSNNVFENIVNNKEHNENV